MENEIYVFQDENADYCIIAGTNDRDAALRALRKTEDEWFGENHTEEKLDINEFSAADIYHGTKNDEDGYYWGADDPAKYFDGGKYEKLDGFVYSY